MDYLEAQGVVPSVEDTGRILLRTTPCCRTSKDDIFQPQDLGGKRTARTSQPTFWVVF